MLGNTVSGTAMNEVPVSTIPVQVVHSVMFSTGESMVMRGRPINQ